MSDEIGARGWAGERRLLIEHMDAVSNDDDAVETRI